MEQFDKLDSAFTKLDQKEALNTKGGLSKKKKKWAKYWSNWGRVINSFPEGYGSHW
ncbi:hypothetical protein [Ligilactobacillus acidipiscis]|uniref:hypothetical protein n=1 Tax=Ligilactobacillus acidipiscis TaxID=89059 RepID=UPI0022E60C68|nr:hypothetical protein [Ligilactobacillus acidipiscis]